MLTSQEFTAIYFRLQDISDNWADLWLFINQFPVAISRIINLKYTDVEGKYILFPCRRRFCEKKLLISYIALNILKRRKLRYPEDIYIFQSHSNRVKHQKKPVTMIAFNQALKKASTGITKKSISSKWGGGEFISYK
ncbi:hypothetical protein [uncultured Enterobacter sp.]|uniref:hypothetical protein n=1 Tax=uncultured Enterobacter sp. TaxID=238202 RepID=UPI0026318A39|nr:hypothetical protein [uncultured Enterobacter sp.]